MYKNKILVLEGGFNEEHEVSLATAKEVKKSLFNQNIEFKSILVSPKNFEEKISKFSNEYIYYLFYCLYNMNEIINLKMMEKVL